MSCCQNITCVYRIFMDKNNDKSITWDTSEVHIKFTSLLPFCDYSKYWNSIVFSFSETLDVNNINKIISQLQWFIYLQLQLQNCQGQDTQASGQIENVQNWKMWCAAFILFDKWCNHVIKWAICKLGVMKVTHVSDVTHTLELL